MTATAKQAPPQEAPRKRKPTTPDGELIAMLVDRGTEETNWEWWVSPRYEYDWELMDDHQALQLGHELIAILRRRVAPTR